MGYRLKRVDPFWHGHPLVLAAALAGGLCGLIGYQHQQTVPAVLGGLAAAAAVLFAARPALSALLGALGLLSGLLTFVLLPGSDAAAMALPARLATAGVFAVFYVVLFGALVLLVAFLYNLYSNAGLEGVAIELESDDLPS